MLDRLRTVESPLLRCRDVTEQASALLDGDLPLRSRMALRVHLALCSMCRTYMDQLRKTRALLSRATLSPPSAEEEDALIARMTGRQRNGAD